MYQVNQPTTTLCDVEKASRPDARGTSSKRKNKHTTFAARGKEKKVLFSLVVLSLFYTGIRPYSLCSVGPHCCCLSAPLILEHILLLAHHHGHDTTCSTHFFHFSLHCHLIPRYSHTSSWQHRLS